MNIQEEKMSKTRLDLKAKLDSRNKFYEENLKQRTGKIRDFSAQNREVISKLNSKVHPNNFCLKKQINEDYPKDENVYLYSTMKKNYYADYVDKHREIYEADKTHYYTFSKDFLTLSFPMVKNKNMEYEEYLENKNKWRTKEGFNRFSTYGEIKEKVYFPKKNNEL